MALTPRNDDLTAGMAGQGSETINPSPAAWITGDAPQAVAFPYGMKTNTVLAARTVVGFDAGGFVVKAVLGTTAAVGVLVYAADSTGIADGVLKVGIYRAGVFNPDLAVWDATYNTAAKKIAAFEGAPTPTNIFMTAPAGMTVA